jgi:protein-histidine pros-kinase
MGDHLVFAEEQVNTELFHTLYLTSQELIKANSPQDLLRIITSIDSRQGLLNATLAYVYTNSAGQPASVEIVAQIPVDKNNQSMIGMRFAASEFAMGYLLRNTSQTLLVSDIEHPHEAIEKSIIQDLKAANIRSLAVIPLVVSEEWVGSINIQWSEPHEFTREERHVYGVLAPQLAALVQNQRLLIQTRSAEQRFRDIAMSSSDWLWEVDQRARYTYCSERVREVLGYTVDEMLDSNLTDFVVPDEIAHVRQTLGTIFANQQDIIDFELSCLSRSGQSINLLISGVPVHNSYGVLKGYRGVAKDITERKRAEEAIKASEIRFRNLFESAAQGIVLVNNHGEITLVNAKIEEIFGHSRDELLGQPLEILVPERFRHVHGQHRSHFFDDPDNKDMGAGLELTGQRKDGSEFPISVSLSHIQTDEGTLAMSFITDITRRKEAEESIQLYADIVKEMQVGLYVWRMEDPQNSRTFRLIATNPASVRATGLTEGEIIGKTIEGVLPSLDEELLEIYADVACNQVYADLGEVRYSDDQLEEVVFALKAFPLPNHSLGVTFDDVTDRVRAKERIQAQNEALVKTNRELADARRRAEDSDRLKSQFLATMSHELRTPLNAIIGYTEIQLAGMTGELSDEQRDYQERILANAENLLTLINEVLDLAKIEAGRIEIIRKPFVVKQLLDEISTQTKGLADKKNLDMRTILDERLPDILIGDPIRLKQIVLNLVSNAIKFTDRGKVTVACQKLDRDSWAVIVSDSGTGIPSHAQEYIFEEFRQVDGTTRRKHGGTGLGLSIVRKLTLMMGGNVRLRSRVGEGTTFTIRLPLITDNQAIID